MVPAWQQRARTLKHEIHALILAWQSPRTPWFARLVLLLVIAYALSPVDLIPDFIPVLGYVDDLLLLPLGIALALRLIPAEVMAECRSRAQAGEADTAYISGSAGRWSAVVIVLLWIITITLLLWLGWRWWAA